MKPNHPPLSHPKSPFRLATFHGAVLNAFGRSKNAPSDTKQDEEEKQEHSPFKLGSDDSKSFKKVGWSPYQNTHNSLLYDSWSLGFRRCSEFLRTRRQTHRISFWMHFVKAMSTGSSNWSNAALSTISRRHFIPQMSVYNRNKSILCI